MWIFTLLFNVIRQHKLKTDSSSKSKIEAELVKTRTNSNDQNQIPAQVTPMIRESWVKRVYSMVCSNVSDWVSANIVKTNSFFFLVPARQSDIPDKTQLHPLIFSSPALIYFYSVWPPLSPRQFDQRKAAKSANVVPLGDKVKVLKSLLCNYQNTVNPPLSSTSSLLIPLISP